MYSITFKAKELPNSKDEVKIYMVFFRSGYPERPQKFTNITGPKSEWDAKAQGFSSPSKESINRNKAIYQLKESYENIAIEWDLEGKEWSPTQWKNALEKRRQTISKSISVSKYMDILVEELKHRVRYKNGQAFSSVSTSKQYRLLKPYLEEFTKAIYKRSFSTYFFEDITLSFAETFYSYLLERGLKNGNKGAAKERTCTLWGVVYYTSKAKIDGADPDQFNPLKDKFEKKKTIPKTIPVEIIRKLEQLEKIDNKKLTYYQKFHIDLFLFGYYMGGMSPIDISHLTWDRIQENGIVNYERIKYNKQGNPPLTQKAKAIIDRYKEKSYANYVLPVFWAYHDTEHKRRNRLKQLYESVNKTLKKVGKEIGYEKKLTWYAMRGTFITHSLQQGGNPMEIADCAGNSVRTIESNYWEQTQPDRVRNFMDGIL